MYLQLFKEAPVIGSAEADVNSAKLTGLSNSASKTDPVILFTLPDCLTLLIVYSNSSSQPREDVLQNEILSPVCKVNGSITGGRVDPDQKGSEVELKVIGPNALL